MDLLLSGEVGETPCASAFWTLKGKVGRRENPKSQRRKSLRPSPQVRSSEFGVRSHPSNKKELKDFLENSEFITPNSLPAGRQAN
jgi:hypothetical protein